jgi:uncharacterized protein with PIN domain
MGLPLRLVVTSELGQLAKHLRLVGIDTHFETDSTLEQALALAQADGRICVTSLEAPKEAPNALQPGASLHSLKSEGYGAQLKELLNTYALTTAVAQGQGFFSLCLQCSHPLLPVKGHHIVDRIGQDMLLQHTDFFLCSRCERVFPKGTYYEQMQKWVKDTLFSG